MGKLITKKVYNDNTSPPRWEYRVSDGISTVGIWSTVEMAKDEEKLMYKRLDELLKEENENSARH